MLASISEPRFENISPKTAGISNAHPKHEKMEPWMTPGLLLSGLGTMYMVNRILSQRVPSNCTPSVFNWDREIIVVTGGSSGVGGATVRKLAERGTTIVVLDSIPLTYVAPHNVHCYKCDVTDEDELQKALATIKRKIGEPSIIVANAGICSGKTVSNEDMQDIESTLGLLQVMKVFLPSLIGHNHGHFLIVGSQAGYKPAENGSDYSIRKSIAMAIFEGIHSELKHLSRAPAVRVSCVSPSHAQTAKLMGINAGLEVPKTTADHLADTMAETLYGDQPMLPSPQLVPRGRHGSESSWEECA